MDLTCEERLSDSPLVERIWRSETDEAGEFISIASSRWEIVVTRYAGRTFLTVRGPETVPTPAFSPAGAEFFGIRFKPGAFMPDLPASTIMDRRDVGLPEATSRSFWLRSSVWQYPNYENADAFVGRLVHDELLVYDPAVHSALLGQPGHASVRTLQRRFLHTTGLTQSAYYQIERAREAARLLKSGLPILDVVDRAGYFDQPHLTRSLKHFIGLTPAQMMDRDRPQRLSFLYKTGPSIDATMQAPRDKYEEDHRFGVRDAGWRYAGSWGS